MDIDIISVCWTYMVTWQIGTFLWTVVSLGMVVSRCLNNHYLAVSTSFKFSCKLFILSNCFIIKKTDSKVRCRAHVIWLSSSTSSFVFFFWWKRSEAHPILLRKIIKMLLSFIIIIIWMKRKGNLSNFIKKKNKKKFKKVHKWEENFKYFIKIWNSNSLHANNTNSFKF